MIVEAGFYLILIFGGIGVLFVGLVMLAATFELLGV